jgi:hypothetical protein
MDSERLISPYLFDGPFNEHTYLDMLQNWFVPQPEKLGIKEDASFQPVGAPAHYALAVRECLSEVFRDCWICRGSPVMPDALQWPPRRPDHAIIPFGLHKVIVAQQHYQTTDDLKQAGWRAFNRFNPQMLRNMSHRTWRRIKLGHKNYGAQTDTLDN